MQLTCSPYVDTTISVLCINSDLAQQAELNIGIVIISTFRGNKKMLKSFISRQTLKCITYKNLRLLQKAFSCSILGTILILSILSEMFVVAVKLLRILKLNISKIGLI